jgi:hypothetical protein
MTFSCFCLHRFLTSYGLFLQPMTLKEVVSVSGKPGLHKIIGRRPNGIIVETLDDQKKKFPVVYTQKVSILEDISIFTYDGDVKLKDVLKNMKETLGDDLPAINKKSSSDEVRAFFRTILPEFDEERVYPSDVLKLTQWYAILNDQNQWDSLLADEEESEEHGEEEE